jgi:predicted ArsR family transcriptional regulator
VLNKLLRLIQDRNTVETIELAREMGVSPELLQEMLERLAQQGYLESVVQDCSRPCRLCPLRNVCHFRDQPRIWALTQKGRQALGGVPG